MTSRFLAKVGAVFIREAKCELRSRFALNAVGMFAMISLLIVRISVGAEVTHKAEAGLLWLVLLFSAMMGLSRTFVREVESHTQDALRLTADPSALLVGKGLFNGALLFGVEAIVLPLFALMTGLPVRDASLFAAVMILGNVGLASASTLLAAIVAKAGGRSALFPVLALPILLPLLMALVGGTYSALAPDPKFVPGSGFVPNPFELRQTAWQAGGAYVRMAVAYAGMIAPASVLLFDLIWGED